MDREERYVDTIISHTFVHIKPDEYRKIAIEKVFIGKLVSYGHTFLIQAKEISTFDSGTIVPKPEYKHLLAFPDIWPEIVFFRECLPFFNYPELLKAFNEVFNKHQCHFTLVETTIQNLFCNIDDEAGENRFELNRCQIENLKIGSLTPLLYNCTIKNLKTLRNRCDLSLLYNVEIEFLNVTKDTKSIYVSRSSLTWVQFESTINLESKFSQCDFQFVVKNLTQAKNEERGIDFRSMLSTYEDLINHKDLRSNKQTLYRYVVYFKTRDHWLKRLLFYYTEGYHLILKPLVGSVLLCSVVIISVYSITHNLKDAIHFTLLSPVKIFTEIILEDLSLENNISFRKILILFCLTPLVYSIYALLTAIKRRFGFGKPG